MSTLATIGRFIAFFILLIPRLICALIIIINEAITAKQHQPIARATAEPEMIELKQPKIGRRGRRPTPGTLETGEHVEILGKSVYVREGGVLKKIGKISKDGLVKITNNDKRTDRKSVGKKKGHKHAILNKVMLMGNLIRDPDIKTVTSGSKVSTFGLALNEKYKDKQGEWKEHTTYADIVVWGKQAQSAADYLHKGDPVLIEGQLDLQQWETDGGDKRSKMYIKAQRIQFLKAKEKHPEQQRDEQRGESGRKEPYGDTGSGDENCPF